MLKDYIADGGQLMIVLAAILFVVLFLVVYATLVLLVEWRRARSFSHRSIIARDLAQTEQCARQDGSVPARLLTRLNEDARLYGIADDALERDRLASRLETELFEEIEWPLEVLHFLGTYAAKIGLCGTILGLCIHFLTVGPGGDSSMASKAMAVALYTTLGALAIALVSEPAAYVLASAARRMRGRVRAWLLDLERRRFSGEPTSPADLESEPALDRPGVPRPGRTEKVETPGAAPLNRRAHQPGNSP